MPLRDGFFSTATQTSCCNRIQRSNRVRLLVVSTHDFPDNLRFVRRARLVLFTRAIISPTSRPRLALAELELYIKVILALVVLDSNHQASLYSLVISKGYLFLD